MSTACGVYMAQDVINNEQRIRRMLFFTLVLFYGLTNGFLFLMIWFLVIQNSFHSGANVGKLEVGEIFAQFRLGGFETDVRLETS